MSMEGRKTYTDPVSPLHDRATTDWASTLHFTGSKGSVSPLHSQSTPKRSVSPFYNRIPTDSVSSLNHNTPKRSASPLHNRTPRGSVSPLHSRAPKGSVSPLHNQASKRSVSPLLGQRPEGSISAFHSQATTSSVSPSHNLIPKRSPSPLPFPSSTTSGSSLHSTTHKRSPSPSQFPRSTASGSSLHSTTHKRSPSPVPFPSSTTSGSSLHSITPKHSVSPLLGKTSKDLVSSLDGRTLKGSVSPLHDKASKQSASPLPSQTSKGLVSPLHSQTTKLSVSPFQHRTSKRSVSPFQHQTPKGSVSPLQSQNPESSVSSLPFQAPTISNSASENQEKAPSNLISPLRAEDIPASSVSPLHDGEIQEEVPASSVTLLRDEEKINGDLVSPLCTQEKRGPNYLKASSSTCHDICKYGERHNLDEEDGKHDVPKSFKKGKNNGEKRKKTIIKLRSLSSGKIVFSEKIEIRIEESLCSNEEGIDPVKWQDIKSYDDASVPSTETQNEGESMNSTNSDAEPNLVGRRNKSNDDTSLHSTEAQNEGESMNGTNSDAEPSLVQRRNKKQVLKSKESNARDAPEKKELSFKKKMESTKKSGSGTMKENTSIHERKATVSAKLKLKEVSDENTRKPVKAKVIGRPIVERGNSSHTDRPASVKVENSPKKKTSLLTLLRSSSGRRSFEGKSEKSVTRKKKGTNMASTSSPTETKEKVLHMIEPKPRKTTSKHSAAKSNEEQDMLKPEKSTFRRGKVVDVPPDPGTTKKLRFRKGRRSNENLGGFQLGRRSFRRKGSISAGSSNSHGQVVVLRHRETEEKKGIQGLFNSIIEETVNKLVKTRKSKVKALVGAFETVISLQDGKSVSVV